MGREAVESWEEKPAWSLGRGGVGKLQDVQE